MIVRSTQTGGITLPVPAEKIKEIRAEIRNLEIDIITDKVVIQGILHKQIFFVGLRDGIVRHIPEDVPFSTFIDVPGALPGMKAQVDVVIEHIKAELSRDGKQLTQKVILEIFVKIVDEVQFTVKPDPTGPLVKAEIVIGENVKQELVMNEVELPVPAIKIADIISEIRITDTEVIKDKVIIQGIIHKQLFYIDVDNVERHIAEDVPFSTFLDIPGALPGDNVQVNAVIELIKRELNRIPGKIVRQEIVFEIFVKVHRTEQINIALGEGPLVKLPFVVGENTKQDLIANDIKLDEPAIKVKEIQASFRNLKAVVIENKVVVQGILHKQIFYVDRDNIERHQAEDIPFSNFLDVPGALPNMDVDFNPIIEDVIFQLRRGNILHQKVVVQYFIKVTEPEQVQVIPGRGPLLKIEEVVGENTKQILIERRVPPPPPVEPITVTTEVIRLVEGERICTQRIIDNEFCLPEIAVKIKSIVPVIRNVEVDVLVDEILVSGEIVKNITFVDKNNVVRHAVEVVPFEFLLDAPGVTPDFTVDDLEIEIENLSFKLNECGVKVEQTIVLKFIIDLREAEQCQVVTDVTGPGIVTEEVAARVELVIVPTTPQGEEPELEVFGPNLVNSSVELVPPAAEIIDVLASVEDFTAETIDGGVVFSGTVIKEVIYLTEGGEEAVETEEVPFEILFEDEDVEASFDVPEAFVTIEDIQISLSNDGSTLEQVILLTFEFKVTDERIITILTDVEGPGIGEVETKVIILDVVGVGPTPVRVVTDVEIL